MRPGGVSSEYSGSKKKVAYVNFSNFEQQLETKGYPTAPVPQEPANGINTSATQAPSNFPAPPQAAAPQQPENFWGSFSETMTRDPQNAWKVLNQVQPNTVQNKLFVME